MPPSIENGLIDIANLRRLAIHSCVVVRYIEPPPLARHTLYHGGDLRVLAHVHRDRNGLTAIGADGIDSGGGVCLTYIGCCDAYASVRKCFCASLAYARTGARYEHDLVGKLSAHAKLPGESQSRSIP
jgi:hypothetical protein